MEKLTDEQIKELSEILSLSAAEQEKKLSAFLEKLSDGQIEYLKAMQQGGAGRGEGSSCIFCSLAYGKVSSSVVYQDDKIFACLDINPANTGHFMVFPKQHIENSFLIQDDILSYLFFAANKLLTKMVSLVGTDSGNIIVSNGMLAGQRANHLVIHCIPRFKDDGIDFAWKPKKLEDPSKIVGAFRGFSIYKKKVEEPQRMLPKSYEYDDFRIP